MPIKMREYLRRKEMKILIPVDIDKKSVCPVLGRAPFYMIFDTEKKEAEIVENPAAQAEGGAGLKAAQFILDCETDVLITPRCGQNAAEVMSEGEIKIYKTEGNDAQENIENYLAGKLSVLEKFHGGYHGHF